MPPNTATNPDIAALLAKMPTLDDVERELCRRSLAEFAKRAWHVLEPGAELKWGWALDAICLHLEAVTDGRITRLLMNVPPGSMKSLLTGVIWPAWEWGPRGMPEMRFVGTAHEEKLAIRDSRKCRDLIKSEWFQRLWPLPMATDLDGKREFGNARKGVRQARSFTSMTGVRGDRVILDDPIDVSDGNSPTKLEAAKLAFTETLPTRVNNEKSAIVVVMQRLHTDDVSGVILERGLPYVHLRIPMRFEAANRCTTAIGWTDPRTKDGELMFPERFGEKQVAELEKTLGSYAAAGQLQQRPAPRGGGTLKRDTYRLIKRQDLPQFYHHIISWDTAATDNENNDPTGATVWGLSNTPGKQGLFKLGQLQEWLTAPQLERRIPDFGRNWPQGAEHLIETAGPTGLAMLQILKSKMPHLVLTGVDPRALGGGKDERAHLASVHLENGLVWLVEDDPDNEAFLTQSDAFPKCKPRDVVDSAIQAILYAMSRYTFEPAGWSYESSSTPETDPYSDHEDDKW